MKKLVFPLMLFALMLTAFTVNAEEVSKAQEPVKVVEFRNQTHCPVMGGPIDSAVYTDIQGQRVYHCCQMCSKKLKTDPDKYFMEAAAKGIRFENIQTTCPVSGKAIDTTVHEMYKGRQTYFCCDGCKAEFAKKPGDYLDILTPSENKDDEIKEQQREDDSHKENMHH